MSPVKCADSLNIQSLLPFPEYHNSYLQQSSPQIPHLQQKEKVLVLQNEITLNKRQTKIQIMNEDGEEACT